MIKTVVRVALVGSMVSLLAGMSFTATRPPSTEAERQHAIELAEWLEEHPLHKDAKLKNTELLTWWTEVPDITFNWCAGILLEHENKKASFVVLQSVFGGGAYLLKHPDSTKDQQAVAGVESALRAYERAKKIDPEVKDAFLEDLLKSRDAKKLSDYVTPHLKKCADDSKK